MRVGTSYFGTYDPLAAAIDLADIARRHDWIVIPVSEELATYQMDNLNRIIRIAQALGLETWVSPWGVANVFGGEGLAAGMSPSKWFNTVLPLKPDFVMFDEPKLSQDSLKALKRLCKVAGVKTAICLEAERLLPGTVGSYDVAFLDGFDSVGTDPYFTDNTKIEEAVHNLFAVTKVPDTHLWVQAFRIKAGRERFVERVIESAQVWGVNRVATWGWRGSGGMGILRSDSPAEVERAVERGLQSPSR
jgi:hypothetical protein